jgi:hypothetical protein
MCLNQRCWGAGRGGQVTALVLVINQWEGAEATHGPTPSYSAGIDWAKDVAVRGVVLGRAGEM